MPLWVIGFLIGLGIGAVKYEVRIHHKPAPVQIAELDPAAAKKFVDCVSAAAVAAGSPATLDCMEDYTDGGLKSN